MITPHPLYLQLGAVPSQRQERYRSLFDGHMPAHTLDEIRDATNKGWVLGNDQFQQQVELATGRIASPQQRGGDRKSESFGVRLLLHLRSAKIKDSDPIDL